MFMFTGPDLVFMFTGPGLVIFRGPVSCSCLEHPILCLCLQDLVSCLLFTLKRLQRFLDLSDGRSSFLLCSSPLDWTVRSVEFAIFININLELISDISSVHQPQNSASTSKLCINHKTLYQPQNAASTPKLYINLKLLPP